MAKRASTQETREALLQWVARNPLPTEDECAEHLANGCNYGRPNGPDDIDECCDCPEDKYADYRREENLVNCYRE